VWEELELEVVAGRQNSDDHVCFIGERNAMACIRRFYCTAAMLTIDPSLQQRLQKHSTHLGMDA